MTSGYINTVRFNTTTAWQEYAMPIGVARLNLRNDSDNDIFINFDPEDNTNYRTLTSKEDITVWIQSKQTFCYKSSAGSDTLELFMWG